MGVGLSIGGEIRKTRPAVIVINDPANRELNCVQVVPLTSNVGRLYLSEATLQNEQPKAMADQIAAISKLRLKDRIGRLGRGHGRRRAGHCLHLAL